MSATIVLRLQIGQSELAVDLRDITEIIRMVELGGMPSPSSLVRGAINLRGEILPVVDVSSLIGQPAVAADPRHYIVIVHGLEGRYGFLVNDTIAVADVPEENRRTMTPFVAHSDALRDVLNLDGQLIPLLHTESIIAAQS